MLYLLKLIKKPTIYYPIILLVVFSMLRFMNVQFEAIYGFRILNPGLMGIVIGYFFGRQIVYERKLKKIAISDPVSGLHNRVGLTSFMDEFYAKLPDKKSISVISIDIDDFKDVNDTHGHQIGDAALLTVGEIVKNNIRSTDVAARCGGDEFVIALPNASHSVAMRIAESILSNINTTTIKTETDESLSLNASIGIATSEGSIVSEDKLFKLSDNQLYKSKGAGKNRISGINI